MKTVGLLLLLFTAFGAEGSVCSFPSPQCYKRSTLSDEDFYCEWEDQDSQSASYTLFIQSSSSDNPSCPAHFETGNKRYKQVSLECVLTAVQSDIWVEKKTESMTCTSPKTSVILNDLVKYRAPKIQATERTAGDLTLRWPRARDNKGAFYEIRWREINASWQNDSFKTEDSSEVKLESKTLNLENNLVYQVQVRRKAIGYDLWSDWSQSVEFPVGSVCPFPSPQCYKRSTLSDEDFYCEWEDQDSQSASYTLFIQSLSSDSPSNPAHFETGNKQYEQVPLEFVLTPVQSDIWVEKKTESLICTSPKTSVILKELVKYRAPKIQATERSAGDLTLSWPRARDNKGAFYEIRWREINASWHNDSFKSENCSEDKCKDSKTLQLESHLVYQIQIRRMAIGYHLWSDWSHTLVFPVEIQAPVVNWKEKKMEKTRTITLNWKAPPPEASYGGVTYILTLKLPCETKYKITQKTYFKMNITDSEARISISANNSVSKSAAREITIPHVHHLKNCNTDIETLPRRRHSCLEWYKLPDGETRPIHVRTSHNDTIESIKKDMQKFVRYYYFFHIKRKQHWHTHVMCPIYSTEGVPVAEPRNVTVANVTHDSALLLWRPIPVKDQHGFLLHYAIWVLREGGETVYHEVPRNATSFPLRNLTTGSSYTVYIAGQTRAGVGPNSTANFLATPQSTESFNALANVILGVFGVVLLLSVLISCAFRSSRLKRKILPMIPSPVIPDTTSYCIPLQNLRATTEEVHDVILLYRDDLNKQNKANIEQSTLLQDCQLSVYEEEDQEDEGDEDHFTNSFPNPNYKGQMLRLPEPLVEEKGQSENNCEIRTSSYRDGSVLGIF